MTRALKFLPLAVFGLITVIALILLWEPMSVENRLRESTVDSLTTKITPYREHDLESQGDALKENEFVYQVALFDDKIAGSLFRDYTTKWFRMSIDTRQTDPNFQEAREKMLREIDSIRNARQRD